ncbi:methyltransferase domain-containing protein [Sulfurimonas sp. HSL-3221]|uniref:class I SAM-dependent methyltransferase n=1 Tax=Sulfurimonadaceae TaxID=2771471 RepID=UPI001E588C04|nr:methyltransferase domain-containing protein [Sulfurimonas sp. HSL-3221]UFS61445.1 methyltransferase domain-containing protein [Sulfurimonas sp. HSL-3221]
MAQKDKEKWDKKYTEMEGLLERRPPSELVSTHAAEAPGARALDLACGGGRHSLYLADEGFSVDAVDISTVALAALREKADLDKINLIEADLDTFVPDAETYDMIVKTNFLDRGLIARAKAALKPGGIMVLETYMADAGNEKPDSNPDFLLQKEELKSLFGEGFSVLEYKEFWNEPHEKYRMRKQAIAVRKD